MCIYFLLCYIIRAIAKTRMQEHFQLSRMQILLDDPRNPERS